MIYATHARKFTGMLAVLIILAASILATSGVEAQRPNGAGVVIRHGDGTLIYAYVQFEEESISGMDLLQRAGLPLSVAPFAGLGTGICSIGGEGCPADDCYCHSYQAPATWWHYYTYAGGWAESPAGPSSRTVHDGDIDGWSWTAGDPGLPAVTIDEIAAMNGVDRNPPTPTPVPPTATPAPTNTPPPPPTSTHAPTATPVPPTATATPTAPPAATSTATAPPAATSSPTPVATTAVPSATPTPPSTATVAAQVIAPTATHTATEAPATATVTATRQPTSVAVIVTPGATPQPLEIEEDGGGGTSNLVLFGVFAALVAVAGGGALIYQRRRAP